MEVSELMLAVKGFLESEVASVGVMVMFMLGFGGYFFRLMFNVFGDFESSERSWFTVDWAGLQVPELPHWFADVPVLAWLFGEEKNERRGLNEAE